MSRAASPSTGRVYGVVRVCREWGVPRSTLYMRRGARTAPRPPARRGPKTAYTDAELTEHIRRVIEASPAFVRAPEGNGVVERFMRTLKEQLLWLQRFDDLEALNRALQDWRRLYNEQWLIERHGHRTPAQVRREWLATQEAA